MKNINEKEEKNENIKKKTKKISFLALFSVILTIIFVIAIIVEIIIICVYNNKIDDLEEKIDNIPASSVTAFVDRQITLDDIFTK